MYNYWSSIRFVFEAIASYRIKILSFVFFCLLRRGFFLLLCVIRLIFRSLALFFVAFSAMFCFCVLYIPDIFYGSELRFVFALCMGF